MQLHGHESSGTMAACLFTATLALLVAGAIPAGALTVEADNWTPGPVRGRAFVTPGTNGNVTILFPALGMGGVPPEGAAYAESSDPYMPLSGDYIEAQVRFISLTTGKSTAYTPSWARVAINCQSGRQWINYNVRFAATSLVNTVGMNSVADGWLCLDLWGASAEVLNAAWSNDLRSVERIGVRLSMNGLAAQSYTVSDLKMESARSLGSLTPLQQALYERFGVTGVGDLTPEQLAQDQDGDGMTDVDEIRAVHEPGYFDDNLHRVEILSIGPGFVVVRWACVAGRHYTLMEAADLLAANPFQPVTGKENLAAPETGYMQTTVDIVDDGMRYYFRVRRDD